MMHIGDMGTGMMSGMWIWMLLCIVVASFIFSVIFWLTYNWLAKKKK